MKEKDGLVSKLLAKLSENNFKIHFVKGKFAAFHLFPCSELVSSDDHHAQTVLSIIQSKEMHL